MEWLAHTNKKHCELCKTSFRFTKLYDSRMPDTLPLAVFIQRASIHFLRHLVLWLRGLLVGFVWLILLPWSVRWAWRGLFYMLDAGWAREPWIARMINEAHYNASVQATMSSAVDTVRDAISASAASTSPTHTEAGPITFQLTKLFWSTITAPWRASSAPNYSNGLHVDSASLGAHVSILSNSTIVHLFDSSPQINSLIVDVVEGQIITFLVVVAFILVFLIREWVIQQQPILNAAAHVREAEQQLNRVDPVSYTHLTLPTKRIV